MRPPARYFLPVLLAAAMLAFTAAPARCQAPAPVSQASAPAAVSGAQSQIAAKPEKIAPAPEVAPKNHHRRNVIIIVGAAVGTALILFFTLRHQKRGCDNPIVFEGRSPCT